MKPQRLQNYRLDFSADKVTVDDLQVKGHPNALPFRGTLLLVDSPSNKPPQGAEGHPILVPKAVAKRLLPTLPGMAINYTPSFDAHAPTHKIGLIKTGDIIGNKVEVTGHIWAKDFPEAAKEIKANKGMLGMSMELADIWVEDKDAKVWRLKDFKFTGGTVLFKKAAAYHDTAIAASSNPLYVKALAAAAAVLGTSFNKKGEATMPTASKKTSRRQGGHSSNSVTRLAAAVSAGVSANIQELLEDMREGQEKSDKILRLMARHMVDEAKAKANGNGKRLKAKGKITDASVDPSGDGSADVSAAADASSEIEAEGEEDELTAAMEELEEEEQIHARKKADSTDDSTEDDASEDDDGSVNAHRGDSTGDSTDDPSYDPSSGVQAEFDESDDHGSSQNEDASTGEVNKKAIKKFRKNSKAHLHGARDINAAAELVDDLRAANEEIAELRASTEKEKRLRKKQSRVIAAMQAQLERHSEIADRRTLTPEVHHLLEKEGFSASDLRASGEKLTVAQVDTVLNADPKMQLPPDEKMRIKNQLLQAGLMEDGAIQRFQ